MVKILIVDDSEELLEILSTFLQMRGYDVKSVSSVKPVRNLLSDFEPDVILLDVRMGGDDGRKLCREIKEKHTKHIPIILTSASPELLKDYEECNADAIIEKPFDIHTVEKKVNSVLHKHQTSNT